MMGKRGPKPKFTNVSCPNQDYKFYGISKKGNIIGHGTYQIKNNRVRKYICRIRGRVFNDLTNTFFDNIHKDESIVKLALKIAIKGMSIQAIASVLEAQPATVSNEDDRAWMWVSFAPEFRLILDFRLEPRKQYVADELIKVTGKHLSDSKLLFVTYGLKFYAESLLKNMKCWWSFLKLVKEEDIRNQK